MKKVNAILHNCNFFTKCHFFIDNSNFLKVAQKYPKAEARPES
eukprot:UN01575